MPWNRLARTTGFVAIGLKVFALLFLIVMVIAVCVVLWAFEYKLNNFPVYIYSTPYRVSVGDDIDNFELTERLNRSGYTRTYASNVNLGEWRLSDWSMSINFRRPPISGYRIIQGPVNISLDSGMIRDIRLMRSQELAGELMLEPEILSVIPAAGYPAQLCRYTPIDDIPSLLAEAIVQTEDSNFLVHHGIDWSSLWIAIKSNLEAGRYVQGASTITQQLIKMTLLSNEKTLWRKLNEIVLSLVADAIYSKRTILEAYLNRVYFGQLGSFPVYGVREAANELLGKSLEELDASDCALLAATIRAPNVINPFRHPERATGRRNIVLGLLLKSGKITREVYDEALVKPVTMQRQGSTPVRVPNLVEYISSSDAMIRATEAKIDRFVVTTIDPLLQMRLEAAIKKFLEPSLSAQAIALAPETGDVLACYAAGNSQKETFRATLDLFAPFVMVPALSTQKKSAPKYSLTSQVFLRDSDSSSATVIDSFRSDRQALIARMIKTLGADMIHDLLRDVGVQGELKSSGEISLAPLDIWKLASIYCVAANLGELSSPTLIYRMPGIQAPEAKHGRRSVVNSPAMYLVNHMLKNVSEAEEGENIALNLNKIPSRFISEDTAGAWGITYNSGILMVLRINGTMKDTTKMSTLMDFVISPLLNRNTPFYAPVGIVFRRICSLSGLKATSMCRKISLEPFISGTQPNEWCPSRHDVEFNKKLNGKTN